MGEDAEDGGGPRREFWRLFGEELKASLLEGTSGRCIVRHDAVALKVGSCVYQCMQMFGMLILIAFIEY